MMRVDSSHIAAVDFVEGMIRIQYKDGSLFEQPAERQVYLELCAAPSKGRFVREYLTKLQKIGAAETPAVSIEQPAAVTDMHDPDECCGRHLAKALREGLAGDRPFICPRCSCEWRGTLDTDRSIRYWAPVVDIQIVRRGA